jgi:hypothetical protein
MTADPPGPVPPPTDRTFFDVHMHAMDLSHPDLLAFLRRQKMIGLKLVLAGLLEPFLKQAEWKVLNLPSVMESDIQDYFCLMEFYLRHKSPPEALEGDSFLVDGSAYETILMTPLVMDFGTKNIDTPMFYNLIPRKPVVVQTEDLFRAILRYCQRELRLAPGADRGKTDLESVERTSPRLLEVYPFLGVNTKNVSDLHELKRMIRQYFEDYTGRREDLLANMGAFPGAMEMVKSNFFAGVKLYPPLGFDPWPVDDGDEMAKVEWLYGFCEEKGIPITVHCGDGGFAVDRRAEERTDPRKWEAVLERHASLKLNLAHFGNQHKRTLFFFRKKAWRERVIKLVLEHPNVYSDLAYVVCDDAGYRDLAAVSDAYTGFEKDKLNDRTLFGSDFMINLMDSPSYNDYLRAFATTVHLTGEQKRRFCCLNPQGFLFQDGE